MSLNGKSSSDLRTQVNYVFRDDSLPTWQQLGDEVIDAVREEFAFAESPKGVEYNLNLLEHLKKQGGANHAAIAALANLEFSRGLYRDETGEGQSAIIRHAAIRPDRLYCMLSGTTDIAEQVVTRMGEIISETTGIAWDDLLGNVAYQNYATASRETLGVTADKLLSNPMQDFVHEVLKDTRYGASMNHKRVNDDTTPSGKYNIVVHPYDFRFKVRVTNLDLGETDVHEVRVSVEDVKDHHAGIYLVQTVLPSDLHEEVVAGLKQFFGNTQ